MDNGKLDSIIRKVRGLLAVAEDNANEDEAQSAFVMAQKLMIKYNIEQSEIIEKDDRSSITEGQATAYKTLFWFERKLAIIIADNFRVKNYLSNRYVSGAANKRRSVVFYGLDQDVKIAKEIFVLANEAIEFYTKRFIDQFYFVNNLERDKSYTAKLKSSYIRGFIEGLESKLNSQRFALQEEYGLVVLTPKIVEDNYAELSKSFGTATSYKIPSIEEIFAYKQGYEDAESIDYTKTTVDDEIVC